MINLPTIQIQIFIKETLTQYYHKVKGKWYDLLMIIDLCLDFSEHCPICGGRDCAQFIGYYERKVIDENGTYYARFPIARYKCQGKGSQKIVKDKTFSLLPYQLVPYTKYSIPFIIKSLKLKCIDGLSTYELQDYLARFGEEEILSISTNQLLGFQETVMEAVHKIMTTNYYPELNAEEFQKSSDLERLRAFLEFSQEFECLKVEPCIRGPCGLGYDFYLQGGGYFKNAWFLFGTPYQLR